MVEIEFLTRSLIFAVLQGDRTPPRSPLYRGSQLKSVRLNRKMGGGGVFGVYPDTFDGTKQEKYMSAWGRGDGTHFVFVRLIV